MMRSPVAGRTALITAAVAATILTFGVLARPLVRSGFIVGHDAGAHITYAYLFNRAIGEGQFPVRWVEGVRPGYSQPLFNFYQPGLYYLVELVHLFVPSLAWSLKLTIVGAWTVGAVFMYLLFAPLGRLPALLAASLFACSPYILLDIFVRSAYPEVVAVAIAPGLLWALDRVSTSAGRSPLAATAVLTALALVCHLPTFLVFSPLFTATVLAALADPARRRGALLAMAACAIGAGLSAFYVVPALSELRLTRIAELTSDYFDYHRHFVAPRQWFRYSWAYGASTEGTNDRMSFQIGVAQLAAMTAAVAALSWLLIHRARRSTVWAISGWFAAVAAALLLMTAPSVVIWDAVPALAYLQFPWRLLMVVTVAAGALGAYALSLIPRPTIQAAIVLAAAISQLALVNTYARPRSYFPPAHMDIDRSGWKYTQSAQERAFVEVGYFPAAARTLPPPSLSDCQVTSGRAKARIETMTAARITFTVDADTNAVVRLAVHAFPGWRVTVDGRPMPLELEPGLGLIQVSVPPGRHTVEAQFENTPIRTLANATTLASLVALVAFVPLSARWRA